MLKAMTGGAFAALAFILPANSADIASMLERINLRPGFKISVYAEMPKPRQMVISNSKGIVFIGWRTLNFGPDCKLYVALGAPCNICDLKANTVRLSA